MKNIDIEIIKNTMVASYNGSVFQKSAVYKVEVMIVTTKQRVLTFLKWVNQMDGVA